MLEKATSLRWIVRIFPYLAGTFAIGTGTVALTGWFIDSDELKRLGMEDHPIQPNLAICFIRAGISLIVLSRRPVVSCLLIILFCVIILFFGAISLLETLPSSHLLPDMLFSTHLQKPEVLSIPLLADLALTCLGFLLLLQNRSRLFNLFLVNMIAVLIFSAGFVGYLSEFFNLTEITESKSFMNIADTGWLIFMLLPAGVVCINLDSDNLNLGLEHQLSMGLTFLSVIILFFAVNSGERVRNIGRINSMIKITVQVKESLRILQTSILDLQSRVRGYIISSDPLFLENPENSMKELPGALWHLDSLHADSPEQLSNMKLLRKLTSERVIQTEKSIYQMRSIKTDHSIRN